MESPDVRKLADSALKSPNQAAQVSGEISSPSSAPKPKLLDQVRGIPGGKREFLKRDLSALR